MKETPVIINEICDNCYGLRIIYSAKIARLEKCMVCQGTGKK